MAPAGVTARPGNGQATVSWPPVTDPDVLTYRVRQDGVVVATVRGTSATVTGLTNGTTYSFTVTAVDPSGNASPASVAVTVVPVVGTVPAQGSGETGGLAVSGDGRFVIVGTRARLEPSDTNTAHELDLLDRTAGTATRLAPLGAAAGSADSTNAAAPAISDDGRYVAFVTAAKPATPSASWSTGLAYRKDTVTGSLAALGTGQASAWEHQVALDPTGRYGFASTAAPVGPGDDNGHTDVLRRDLDNRVLTLVSADADGRTTTGPTGAVTAAEYGRVVAVSGDLVVLTTSQALLPADTNRLRDLYVKDVGTGAVLSPVG